VTSEPRLVSRAETQHSTSGAHELFHAQSRSPERACPQAQHVDEAGVCDFRRRPGEILIEHSTLNIHGALNADLNRNAQRPGARTVSRIAGPATARGRSQHLRVPQSREWNTEIPKGFRLKAQGSPATAGLPWANIKRGS